MSRAVAFLCLLCICHFFVGTSVVLSRRISSPQKRLSSSLVPRFKRTKTATKLPWPVTGKAEKKNLPILQQWMQVSDADAIVDDLENVVTWADDWKELMAMVNGITYDTWLLLYGKGATLTDIKKETGYKEAPAKDYLKFLSGPPPSDTPFDDSTYPSPWVPGAAVRALITAGTDGITWQNIVDEAGALASQIITQDKAIFRSKWLMKTNKKSVNLKAWDGQIDTADAQLQALVPTAMTKVVQDRLAEAIRVQKAARIAVILGNANVPVQAGLNGNALLTLVWAAITANAGLNGYMELSAHLYTDAETSAAGALWNAIGGVVNGAPVDGFTNIHAPGAGHLDDKTNHLNPPVNARGSSCQANFACNFDGDQIMLHVNGVVNNPCS